MNVTPRAADTTAIRMSRKTNCARLAAAVLASLLMCAEGAESLLIREARKALSENIPQAAIVKLKAALASIDLGIDERPIALRLLAEAQLNAERPSEALDALGLLPATDDADALLLRAFALTAGGRHEEALPIFQTIAATPNAPAAALLGHAESLQGIGRTRDAIEVLKTLVRSGRANPAARMRLANLLIDLGKSGEARELLRATPKGTEVDEHWRNYLDARIHLLDRKPQAALAAVTSLIGDPGMGMARPTGLTLNLHAAAKLVEAEAKLARSGPDAAEKSLESFLLQNPDSPHLDLIFRRLDRIYALEQNPSESTLNRMAIELPEHGAGLAQYYLGRLQIRQKFHDRAAATLATFLNRFANRRDRTDHPMTPHVHAALADVALAKGDLAAAEAALDAGSRTTKSDDLHGQFALRTALINLQQREFIRASTGFRTAARQSPWLKQRASFDAALAWLKQKNHARFNEEFKAYVAEFPDTIFAGSLRLEDGLERARSRNSQAPSVLRAFLTDFPGHPRRAEAQIAFAELALNEGKTAEAAKLAEAVPAENPSPEMIEQSEYLAVFLEDAKTPRDEEKVIASARNFISRHPASALLGEVRMKLGEVYFQREDFLKAQEQFETLAQKEPDGPYATPALFLAGQCAMRLLNNDALNRALELFGSVAEKHGPLEQYARLQQAIIKNKLGAPEDAVRIYDSILSRAQPLEVELRLAALTGKGDNLVTLGKGDPKQFSAAIATYEQVMSAAGASPSWRNQAAYKKAKVLQQLEKNDEAITVFYDILNKTAPRETFWFSKAGFDAAGIAEARREWKSAAGIYDKMAAVPGPHAEQARQRAKTLRLEHFLWD